MEKTKKPRSLKWFLDRVGKRIYRDDTSCTCGTCKKNNKDGLIVNDEQHAEYLHTIQNDFAFENKFLNYRDEK